MIRVPEISPALGSQSVPTSPCAVCAGLVCHRDTRIRHEPYRIHFLPSRSRNTCHRSQALRMPMTSSPSPVPPMTNSVELGHRRAGKCSEREGGVGATRQYRVPVDVIVLPFHKFDHAIPTPAINVTIVLFFRFSFPQTGQGFRPSSREIAAKRFLNSKKNAHYDKEMIRGGTSRLR